MGNATKRDKVTIACEFLELSRKEFERAARKRIYFALLARRHNVTNAQIGASLGITESAVRAIVKRYGGGEPSDVLSSTDSPVGDE